MKDYKKVEMVAKNAPSGSYAAGCPQNDRGSDWTHYGDQGPEYHGCVNCERTR